MFISFLALFQKTTYLIFSSRYKKLSRFVFSGGTAALTNLLVLFLLVHFLHIYYLFASVVAFSGAIVVNFTLQKFLTFEDYTEGQTRSQFITFTTINGINIIINTSLMYFFVTFIGIWYLTSQIIASIIIASISYFSYKNIVFRKNK